MTSIYLSIENEKVFGSQFSWKIEILPYHPQSKWYMHSTRNKTS